MTGESLPSPGSLVELRAGVYWYNAQRIECLEDRPLLLLGYEPTNLGRADGMTMSRSARLGIATLLIDGVPRSVWIHDHTLRALGSEGGDQ